MTKPVQKKIFIKSYGCQMNVYDSRRIMNLFEPQGYIVTNNSKTNKIEFELSDKEIANRQKNWKMPPYKANRGTLYKYIKNVKTASEGCVTDE